MLKQSNLFYLIIERENLFIHDLNKIIEAKWHDYKNYIEEDYICLFSIEGLFVLSKWIDNKEKKEPKEMAKIIEKAITNFSKLLYEIEEGMKEK